MTSEIAALRAEMETFKQGLEPITKIVRGDGPVQSLGTQIELIKQDMGHTIKTVSKNETKIKDLEDTIDELQQEDKRGKWLVLAAFVTGALALAGAIVTAIISIAKK
jgi:prefoldin subunit 5